MQGQRNIKGKRRRNFENIGEGRSETSRERKRIEKN
jgi:hypothetical protein